MRKGFVVAVAAASLLLAACSSNKKAESAKATTTTQAANDINPADYDLNGTPVTLAGITFTPPTNWTDLGPSGMRKADYYLSPVNGETDSATVTVFYFGPTGGGTIDANIDRWIGQMAVPNGDAKQAANEYTMTVDSMPVHVMSVDGTFNASMGGPMSGQTEAKPNYEMVGVVVEAPQGNVFFKLTGPTATAKQMANEFLAMVKSIKKAA